MHPAGTKVAETARPEAPRTQGAAGTPTTASPPSKDDDGLGIDMESHPLYLNLAHIKTKKVKELEFYKRYIYTLQRQLSQSQRRRASLLPWEEVARALQDDTLDRVRDNRRLQQDVDANKRLCGVLKPWIRQIAMLESPTKPPTPFQACWRQAHLFAGDDSTRQVGSRWLLQHMHHNMEHALREVSFPSIDDEFIDVRLSDRSTYHADRHDLKASGALDAAFTSECAMELLVAQQFVVDFPLELVADGMWAANRTFAQFYLKQDFAKNYHELTPQSSDADAVEYAREELGTPGQRICSNWIQGRFHEENRVSILVKTILDDAYPLEEDAWTMQLQHWIVLHRVAPAKTVVRIHYAVHQPSSTAGFVPLPQVARARNVECANDEDACHRIVERELRSHRVQRELFPVHLNNVLHHMASDSRSSLPATSTDPVKVEQT